MAPRALCRIPLGGIEFKGVALKVIALVASRLPQLPWFVSKSEVRSRER